MNIEIMRNTLYKAYLDDFARFCSKLGNTTAEVMGDLLSFEVWLPNYELLFQLLNSYAPLLVWRRSRAREEDLLPGTGWRLSCWK